MKRYFVVNEFFGIRLYDSKTKVEQYYTKEETELIKKKLKGEFYYIDNKRDEALCSPIKISMNITKKCNLRCEQCFSDSGECIKEELTKEYYYKLFDDMNKNGTFFICLGGGEPFTREDLFDILEYGKSKQLAISIVSNGLLLNKEKLLKLNEMDLDYLWISFEGMKENHEKLRGASTFDRTIDILRLMKEYYKGKKALRMSINNSNIGDINGLVKIAEDFDFDLIRFTPLLSFGRAEGKNLVIDANQYIEFLNLVKNIKTDKLKIVYPNIKTNKIWIGENGFGCHCGKEAIWVDEIGDVSPCIFWGKKYIIGNIKEESYMELWNKCLEISNIEGNDICKKCDNYTLCRGGCRARSLFEFDNLNEVDPLCPKKKVLLIK